MPVQTETEIHAFAQSYVWDGADEGGSYTPTDAERVMIEDAIEGYLAAVQPESGLLAEAETIARAIDPEWWKWADVHYDDSIPGDRMQKQASLDRAARAMSALAAPAQPESRAVPVGGFVAGARVRVKDTGETGEIIRCPVIVQADEDDGTQAAMGGTKWIGEFDPSQLELLPLSAAPAQPVEAQTQEKVVVTPGTAARVLYENWSGLASLPSPARELASQGHFFSALRLLFEPDADLTKPPKATSSRDDIHPDDLAVERFATAMKAKLAKKRDEGRSGWEDKDDCSQLFLSQLLREHVEKGDPVDVGNLAMMLHQRDERISSLLETLQGE